jgi:hypothetical protein
VSRTLEDIYEELRRHIWPEGMEPIDADQRFARILGSLQRAYEAGRAAWAAEEREACAALVVSHRETRSGWVRDVAKVDAVVAAIRARGQEPR